MVSVFPETHEAWLQERKFGIGGSDAAAILGWSRWKSNVDLWEEKTGEREPEDISWKKYVEYGHNAEPHIRGLFALDHPEYEVIYESPYKIIRNDEHPWLFATLDGELIEKKTGQRGILEIKTTEIRRAGQWNEWNEKIPDVYFAQICHQLLATGYDFVVLKARIKHKNGITEREYTINREEVLEDLEALLEKETEFWSLVANRIRPARILPDV